MDLDPAQRQVFEQIKASSTMPVDIAKQKHIKEIGIHQNYSKIE